MNASFSKKATPLDSKKPVSSGQLFVVATPIGNLHDFSHRAQQVLSQVSVILAEDTRHSKRLLSHYGISTRLRSCHQHNEAQQLQWIIKKLDKGDDIALISDAGTPLISDPGFVLVRGLREQGYTVSSIPGPSALIAALSIAGLATDCFIFDGFLPAKRGARQQQLQQYLQQPRTVVVYESSHRINDCLQDCLQVLGEQRRMVIARELTKTYETVLDGTLEQLFQCLQGDKNQQKGEFVLMIEGVKDRVSDHTEVRAWLQQLIQEMPLKQAVGVACRVTGENKNELYQIALGLKNSLELKNSPESK